MSGQSRRRSLAEALANVVVGYALAVGVQLVSFPVLGIVATPTDSLALGALFTGVSLARSYALRRLFARLGPG